MRAATSSGREVVRSQLSHREYRAKGMEESFSWETANWAEIGELSVFGRTLLWNNSDQLSLIAFSSDVSSSPSLPLCNCRMSSPHPGSN